MQIDAVDADAAAVELDEAEQAGEDRRLAGACMSAWLRVARRTCPTADAERLAGQNVQVEPTEDRRQIGPIA